MEHFFVLDGEKIPFSPGQTIMDAATEAGKYIPHLCYREGLSAHGSCRMCVVKINNRHFASCTTKAGDGMIVRNRTHEMTAGRRTSLQLLFVEGNHYCPSCERCGDCTLQATAYEMGMLTPHFDHFFPDRRIDASHPDVVLELNRCILCELCVRASREIDGKNVFALAGRGMASHLVINSESGRLVDSDFAITDYAARVCPVGVFLKRTGNFGAPIGDRTYDGCPISSHAAAHAHAVTSGADHASDVAEDEHRILGEVAHELETSR